MRIKFNFLSLFFLLFCVSGVFGQKETPDNPKTIDGAIVNGKAVNLAKPAYPAAAKMVRASGTVYVQVTINEEGVVISAEAIAGHPLLRAEAVRAAENSTFLPTTLSGSPVKVTGVIVYNFVLPMSFLQIGYETSFAEKSASLSENFPAANISSNIPADWEAEKKDLSLLSNYIFKSLVNRRKNEETVSKKPSEKKPRKKDSETKEFYIAGSRTDAADVISDPNAVLKELGLKIENRLKTDDLQAWYFKLGQILGKINAEIESSDKTVLNIDELDKHLIKTPLNVSETIVNKTRAITEFSRSTVSESEKKQQLTALVRNLIAAPF